MRIVDAVRKAAPAALCQCELVPLFDMSQPAVLRHLRVLVDAGILDTERRGAWRYYFARPEALKELNAWMT
jgi:ArsR family transcriptional regulator